MVISELSVDEPRLDYLTERFSSHPVWSVWSHLCIPNTNHGFLTQFKPDLSIAPSLYLEWNYKYNNCSALDEIIYCSINILIAVVLTVYIGISFKERLRGSFLTDIFFFPWRKGCCEANLEMKWPLRQLHLWCPLGWDKVLRPVFSRRVFFSPLVQFQRKKGPSRFLLILSLPASWRTGPTVSTDARMPKGPGRASWSSAGWEKRDARIHSFPSVKPPEVLLPPV